MVKMEVIVKSIWKTAKEIEENFQRTRGSVGVLNVLNSYEVFTQGMQDKEFQEYKRKQMPQEQLETQTQQNRRRGRPRTRRYGDEVLYLSFLVERLYDGVGQSLTPKEINSLKDLFERWTNGADFFDHRSKWWIDVFSAMDKELQIFSKEDNNFSFFYRKYIELSSKLNTKTIVPFYSRWINHIAALYTIYFHGTHSDYQKTCRTLRAQLKERKPDIRRLQLETSTISGNIEACFAGARDSRVVLGKLCQYISNHSTDFIYASGRQNEQFRRYYCAIKEMLEWIKGQGTIGGEGELIIDEVRISKTYLETFIGGTSEKKDQSLRGFEAELAGNLLHLCQRRDWNRNDIPQAEEEETKLLELFLAQNSEGHCWNHRLAIAGEVNQTNITEGDVVFDVGGEYRARTEEEVADGIVRMLRFYIMLIQIWADAKKADDELPRSDEVVREINTMMNHFGLLPLSTFDTQSYNNKSFLDFCVVKCIPEIFDEET